MSKKAKQNTVNDEIQTSLCVKFNKFRSALGIYIRQKDLNFYYDIDDSELECEAKTELLDYDFFTCLENGNLDTDLEERTKYSTNLRIALFFGYLTDEVGIYESGCSLSVEEFENIVRGILFEEDFEKYINIDELNQFLEKNQVIYQVTK